RLGRRQLLVCGVGSLLVFFFQAEDGIRDWSVTGVQTCALPIFRVRPGETFEVQTQLNRGPWLDGHPDGPRLTALLRGGNPASGCVYVEGAEPGMALVVHVGPIVLDPLGFTRFRAAHGALPGRPRGPGARAAETG